MLSSVTLLVTKNPQLIRSVQHSHDECDLLRLEVCGIVDKAQLRLKSDDVVLILVHMTPELDQATLRRFLREAASCPRATTALICGDPETVRNARSLLHSGAVDLLCLPDDSNKLVQLMNRAAQTERKKTTETGETITLPTLAREGIEQLSQLRRAAVQDATILLAGETGTGKTVMARKIHDASPRRDKPFRIVCCGALSTELIDSELFGHVKGAFTNASADRVGKLIEVGDGTLVLDEINSLPLSSQVKLLRAIGERGETRVERGRSSRSIRS